MSSRPARDRRGHQDRETQRVAGRSLGRDDTRVELDRTLALLAALAEHDVDYVVVGAVALNLHGIVRATEDVDLFVRADETNIARLRDALSTLWDDPEIELISVEDLAGDYPVVRYGPPGEDFVIDLVSRLGETVAFDDLQVETLTVEGVQVRVASPATL